MKVTLLGYVGNGNIIMGVAAKTCYSSLGPLEISQKLLTLDDLQKNNNLVQKVLDSGHQSIAEHVYFTFAIEGISRACSHQLVRHRHCTFSQQSQRYVEIKEDYNALIDLRDKELKTTEEEKYLMEICKRYFVDVTANNYKQYLDALITYLYEVQINKNKPEDARQFLPNATKTNIVMTCNLRELMHIANLRLCTRAQKEIRTLVRNICDEVIKIPGYEWLDKYLQPKCKINGFCDEHNSCGFKIKKEDIFKLLKINTVESKINEI